MTAWKKRFDGRAQKGLSLSDDDNISRFCYYARCLLCYNAKVILSPKRISYIVTLNTEIKVHTRSERSGDSCSKRSRRGRDNVQFVKDVLLNRCTELRIKNDLSTVPLLNKPKRRRKVWVFIQSLVATKAEIQPHPPQLKLDR